MSHLPSKNQHTFHPVPAHKIFSLEDVGQGVDQRFAGILESLTNAIVESSNDAIFGKTVDGIVLSWNSGAERIYGYSALEMIGQSIRTLVPADRRQEWEEIMQRLPMLNVKDLDQLPRLEELSVALRPPAPAEPE